MRGDDARYVNNNGDNDQANTRLRGFFFSLSFFLSPSSRLPYSRYPPRYRAPLLREFPFFPLPPSFLSFSLFLFFQKKKHLLQPPGRFSKGWPDFIPSRCAPSGSAPLEKTLNTLLNERHESRQLPGAAFLSRFFLSFTLPRDPVYLSVSKDIQPGFHRANRSVKGVFLLANR